MNDVKSLTHEWVQPICLKLMKASTGFLCKKVLSEDEYVWHALNDKAPGSYYSQNRVIQRLSIWMGFRHLQENTTSVSLLKESGSQIKDMIAIKAQEFGRIIPPVWNVNAMSQITPECEFY